MNQRQKILIVDDKPENLVALRQVLRDVDAEVVAAASGNEALVATLDHHFALAVLDVQMPEMSGYELAALLREDEKTSQIPIIFLTAYSADEQSVFKGYESGGIDYIVKPYNPVILRGKARIFLELDRSRQELARHRQRLEEMVDRRTQALHSEIIERRKALERVEHLNSVLHAIRNINQLIVREKDPERLIREACELLVQARGYAKAWIILGSPQGGPQAMAVAAGDDQGHAADIADLARCWPPCRQMALERPDGFVVLEDRAHCAQCPLLGGRPDGVALVRLLSRGNEVMGLMGVDWRGEAEPDQEEKSLLDEVVGDIAFALHDIRIVRQHDLFAEIVANSQEAMSLVDTRYRFLKVNPSYQRLVGRELESIEGHHVADVLGRDFFENVIKAKLDRCLSGETVRFETWRRTPDGQQRLLEALYSPCRSEDGGIYGLAVAIRDITEMWHAEQALQRSAELLLETGRLARVGGWTVDPDSLEVSCTEVAREILGTEEPRALTLDQALAVFHPDDRPVLERAMQKALGEGAPFDLELRCATADGRRIWTHVRCRPRLENGRPVSLAGSFQDVTERKQAEIEREQLAAAIKHSSDMVMITDPQGNIQYVNPAFERVTGYAMAEVLGKNPNILSSGEQSAPFYEEMWDTITQGRAWQGRMVNKCKDGGLFTEDASISPVFDAGGGICNYVAIKADITERLRLDEEKRHMEEQMRQAQKMESIGRLAGGVAHDFNNMLSIIMGYAEIAADEAGGNETMGRYLEQILDAATRSRDLTRQLLAFARRQTVNPRMVDLNELLNGSQKMLGRLIGEDIDLSLTAAEGLWPVRLDPAQVDQIIANLAVNARDAISGVGTVTISTENVNLDSEFAANHLDIEPGEYVRLRFADNGMGMEPNVLEQIFEPFFTTKVAGKGTGLGLSTVYGIVRQAGGLVEVASRPGEGTVFDIYLPRGTGAMAEDAVEEGRAGQVGNETILVVEDEEHILDLCRKVLTRAGYRVLAAGQPGDALIMAEKHPEAIHLLLSDVVMPYMNGKELKERLERIKPGIKALFMSGYTADIIAHRGVLAEGVEFLQKPFATGELTKKIRRLLDKK